MKKSVLILWMSLPFMCFAQLKYEFSSEIASYQPLTNPDNTYTTWTATSPGSVYLSGNYKAFGKTYNMNANALTLLQAGGFISCDDGTDIFFFKGMSEVSYVPRVGGKVVVKVEGTGSTTVFKAEWSNVGIKNMPDSIYANFQIWWEAATGNVSVHIGPHNLIPAHFAQGKGASVGMFMSSSNLTQVKETCFLEGSADSPVVNRAAPFKQMNGVPVPNTLYHFKRPADPASVNNPSAGELISVWPNPVADKLIISTILELRSAEITDQLGRPLIVLESGAREADLGNLPAGFYMVRLVTREYGTINKIILRR